MRKSQQKISPNFGIETKNDDGVLTSMNRLSISKEKVKKSIECSTGSKKRASPTFENPPAAEDEKMTCQTDLKNLFYSLKKTKVFEQAIFKNLTLSDLKLLPEYQK